MPYCLIVSRGKRSPLIKGPYNMPTAERKKDNLEEKAVLNGEDVNVSMEEVNSWTLSIAQQELRDRLTDELGAIEGARNFSHKE